MKRAATRIAALCIWAVSGCALIEMGSREVLRLSPAQALFGIRPTVAWVVFAAGTSAILGILALPRKGRIAALFLALATIGIALQLQLGARLQSDGFYYFAYLRSMAFDGDVNFMNDYRMLGLGDKTNLFEPTRTGYAQSAWTIGPAIVWSPFFALGHVAALALHAKGADVATDGTSFPYRQAICLASLFYGLLGCWFAYRLTHGFFPGSVAASAVVLTVCGSFMLWYLVKEPTMTHASSMASVAGFLWMWASTRERRTLKSWALLGLLAGLMALIRWQNLLFALLPGLDALHILWRSRRAGDKAAFREAAAGSAAFLVCAAVAFLPQMLAWHSIYGSFIARSPVGPQIRWTDPHLVDILWSARNGLFSTAPILYLGAIGLLVFALIRPAAGLPLLAAVALMIYFNACIQDWWGSAGFGGRRFDGLIPLFCVGLAAFIDSVGALVRRHAVAFVTACLALAAVWNIALIGAAQSGAVRIGETLPFDRAWAAQSRVIHSWFGNPFTYPASLLFALRNGVSPGEYDRLSTDRFLADPLRPYARIDIGSDGDDWLVVEGWHAPEREGATTFRWAASPAILRIPLDRPARLRVQVRLHAFSYPDAPAQSMTVSANGHACAPLPVARDWGTVECDLDGWRAGVNLLALEFQYVKRPVDAGIGTDPRPLAAAIDYVRITAL
jgi:hypothetical protein